MTSLQGPDVAQVQYKPVIEISDSKKVSDGVLMKVAGSNGATEFTVEVIVTIYGFIGDFLTMKGIQTPPPASSSPRGASILHYGTGVLTDSGTETFTLQ